MSRMRCSPLWMAVLLCLPCLGTGVSGSDSKVEKEEEAPAQGFARLKRGMTPEQVRQHVGPPKRIARQILYHRHLEQWCYDLPTPAHLQFDCRRGQKPLLLWVSTTSPEPGDRGGPTGPH